MPNAKSGTIDIYDRIDKFVLSAIQFTKLVPRSIENIEILKQVIRSICSIGANANEADGSLSHKEFLHTFSIARRESKETAYWLRLLLALNPNLRSHIEPLIDECNQLTAILSKILLTSRQSTS